MVLNFFLIRFVVAYFRMRWAYFQERGFSKVRPLPSLSRHLSSSHMSIFSRDYGTIL